MIGALSLVIARDWNSHKLRLALTIAGIALGVAVFFAIQTANKTLVGSLNTTIEKLAGKATLQVVAGDASFSQDVLKDVKTTSGVLLAEAVTETIAETSLGTNQRILILGLDTTSDLALYNSSVDQGNFVVKNPLAFANHKDSVAVTRTLAEKFKLKDGDKFTVNAQTGPIELTVRGIFSESGIGEVYDGNVAVMDIYSAQDLFGRGSKIDRIDIANAPDTTVEKLQNDLKARLPKTLDVVRPDLRGQSLENTISTMHVAFTITSVLALTISIFIIFNSFSISLNQRWKDIAVLRAVGVESGNVRRMFLVEAIILGSVGSALGVALGFLIAQAALSIVIKVTAVMYGFASSATGLAFDPAFATEAFFLGLIVSLIAAWLPARSAANLEPALALRNIETRQPDAKSGRIRIVAGLIFIAAGLLLTKYTPPNVGSYIQMSYSFVIQIGVVLLLPKSLEIGAVVLRPVMHFLFGAEGVMAVETMARSPRRTVATVGAIVVGLSFVFSNASLVQSQKSAINRSID